MLVKNRKGYETGEILRKQREERDNRGKIIEKDEMGFGKIDDEE